MICRPENLFYYFCRPKVYKYYVRVQCYNGTGVLSIWYVYLTTRYKYSSFA